MGLEEIVKKPYTENDPTLCFKTTPVAKIIVLSIVTYGIYDIILFLNYWKSLKENFGYKVSPFWRGLFCPISNFWLFPVFEKYFSNFNSKLDFASGLAIFYLICSYAANKIGIKTAGLETTDWTLEGIFYILCIITALIAAFIQNKINKINEQYFPDAPQNPWKVSNTIWTIIFIVTIVFSYLPE